MPDTIIIGFHGRKRSGKDTLTKTLEGFMDNVANLKFADPLKNAVCAMFGITREELERLKDDECELVGKTWRYIQQSLGTEWGRMLINEDIWMLLSEQALKKALESNEKPVFSDVRFKNEADLIHKYGGYVIHVVRPSLGENKDSHASEAELPPEYIDFTIVNDGSIDDLMEKMESIINKIRNQ